MLIQERRIKALSELLKILRPGGQALVYVWALEQELNKVKSKYLKKHSESENSIEQISSNNQPGKRSKFDSECVESKVSDPVESVHREKVTNKSSRVYHEKEVTNKLGSVYREDEVTGKVHKEYHRSKVSKMFDKHFTENTDSDDMLESACFEDKILSTEKGMFNTSSDEKVLEISDKSETCDAVIGTCIETHNSESQDRLCDEKKGHEKPSKPFISSAKLEVHVNRTKFKQQDVLVPWQLKNKGNQTSNNSTFHRFYHVFQKGEIEALCEDIDSCRVVTSYYDQGNWAVILEKC